MFDKLQQKNPTAKIIFYVSSMDYSGRESFWGHSPDESLVKKQFEEAKPDNYDMHLYKALAIDEGDNGWNLIHDEVIDTYIDESEF